MARPFRYSLRTEHSSLESVEGIAGSSVSYTVPRYLMMTFHPLQEENVEGKRRE